MSQVDPKLYKNLKSPLDYLFKWEQEKPNDVFLRQPYGDTWKEITWQQAIQDARKIARALKEKYGMQKGDHIGLMSKNCYHWVIADMAIMMGGFVSIPLYANLAKDQLQEVIPLSDMKMIFLGKFDNWSHKIGGIPKDIAAIKFPHYEGNAVVDMGDDWDELLSNYEPMQENHTPDLKDTWSILFTSGTTGTPKGVVHDYKNCGVIDRNEKLNDILKSVSTPHSRFFSFLPLNHIAERSAIELAAIHCGGTISFAQSLDTFAKNLRDTNPTFFFAVPRIWTKFYLGVLSKMPQKKLDRMLKIPIVSGMVKKKIKNNLGLASAHTVLTGASITPESLKHWYRSLGINLREVYGMTENFGGFTLMPEYNHKPNTVGKPMPNCEFKLDSETKEIIMKVPYMMKGYYKDAQKTAEVLQDGWLRTGDMGEDGGEGYLKIVGRVKDTFKTSKGKFVVPSPIEKKFGKSDLIEQICISGLGIPQPVALVNLSEQAAIANKDEIQKKLNDLLDEVNGVVHGHERIAGLVITKDTWTSENNMLTPTLKIKRNSIHQRYCEHLRVWCECDDKVIWED